MSLAAELLFVFLALAWICLAGWAIARLFGASLSLSEVLAWSLACGVLFQARLYHGFLLAGARPGAGSLIAGGAAVLGLSLFIRRRFERGPACPPVRRAGWILALVLAVPVLLFLLDAIAEPMWTTDYLAIWGLKAKTIFLTGSIPPRLFHDPFTEWSHPEYPLLLPLSLASVAAAVGHFEDQALALLFPAFQAATVLLLFGHLRRRVSFEAGAAAAIIAAFCLPLYRAANVGAADIPFAFASVLAATACFDAIDEERLSVGTAARLLIASHMAAGFKQEGTLFVALLGAAVFVRGLLRAGRSSSLASVCLFAPAAIQFAVLRVVRGPVVRRDFDWTLLSPDRWKDSADRGLEVLRHLVRFELAASGLALAGLVMVLFCTRRRREDLLVPVLIAQAAAYAAAASLSAFGPDWMMESAFDRTAIALVPALALALGARAGTVFPARS